MLQRYQAEIKLLSPFPGSEGIQGGGEGAAQHIREPPVQ